MFNTNEPPKGKYPAYAYKSWRKADGELDPKPLSQWVMEFDLLQNHLIQPESSFEDMDWEKSFFFHSLLGAKADRERKAHEDAAKKAKEEISKSRKGRR